jgi:hypothetical protein
MDEKDILSKKTKQNVPQKSLNMMKHPGYGSISSAYITDK